MKRPARQALVGFTLAVSAQLGACQNFVYVEPDNAACPAAPAAALTAKAVPRGVAVAGKLSVSCGFDKGSYTVSLNSTDPGASFVPKTMLVNFGRIVGSGAYTVTFATPGAHSVAVAITSNMGSPVLRGRFVSAASALHVTTP